MEQRVGKDRRCPHCGTEGAYKHGITRGLQRYRCAKGCGRTFNAASDSPLSGLHHKEKWLAFAAAQMRLETVRESARSCGIAVSTAFRWRHRFLSTQTPNDKLQGVVEVDETLFLHSRKGDRKVKDEREPRARGGTATQRGRSSEQVAVLTAVQRGGPTRNTRLPGMKAKQLKPLLAQLVVTDSVMVSDGHKSYAKCATELGLQHETIVVSREGYVRGTWHLQNVNNRHERLKNFVNHRCRGVSTKWLDSYLRWFHRCVTSNTPTSAACLDLAL